MDLLRPPWVLEGAIRSVQSQHLEASARFIYLESMPTQQAVSILQGMEEWVPLKTDERGWGVGDPWLVGA